MVSKVAVIALVGILAIPILLGFGLNLDEVTTTEYRVNNDSVNVTPLLENSTSYTTVHANINQLNTIYEQFTVPNHPNIDPRPNVHYPVIYDNITTTATSYFAYQTTGSNYTLTPPAAPNYYYYYITVIAGNTVDNYVGLTIDHNGSTLTFPRLSSVVYYDDTETVHIQYGAGNQWAEYTDVNSMAFYQNGTFTGNWYTTTYYKTTGLSQWVDFSSGFHFVSDGVSSSSTWRVFTPQETQSLLMTLNLDSVEDANRTDELFISLGYAADYVYLSKTTTDGVVKWEVRDRDNELINELYYDPSRTDNTYQVLVSAEYAGEQYEEEYDAVQKNYTINYKFRYVGSWPSLIGAAEYYLEYDHTGLAQTDAQYPISLIKAVYFSNTGQSRSLTMRMDDALYSAFQYGVIDNQTYTPSDFKSNPSTKLTNIQKYGLSITFGGNTYPVGSDGNITIGTHQVSLRNIVFDSVPVPVGYENRINGNVISVSAQPSSITFGGSWSMNVTTSGQDASTINKTEWIPGQFAWNGMDDNFLMVGLITCLGVFIGLGIYARSHRMSIWPLLLVCGGAAALFIFMI